MARRGLQRTVNLTLAALVLAVAAAAAVSFVLQRRVEGASEAVRRAESGIVAVLRLSIAVRDAYTHQAHVVILNDNTHVDHYGETAELMFRAGHATLLAVKGTAAEPILVDVNDDARRLDEVFLKQVVPNIGGDRKILLAPAEDAIHRVERMQEKVNEAAALLTRDVEAAHQNVAEAATQSRNASVAVLVIALLVALASAFSLDRALSKPLRRLESATESVAKGDLTTRITDDIASRPDELGSLATRFNAMATALREREARLLEAERLAAVGRLAAGVAHEINNPLGVILGTARLLEKRVDADGKKDVNTIAKEVERCRVIVGGLLDLARPPRIEPAALDLGELCEETAERLGPTVSPTIEVNVSGDPHLEADREKVRQIVTNLLMNSSHAGATRIAIIIDGSPSDVVRMSISDDGGGVAPDMLPRLFAPFATGRADGTGLGLAVSRSIAQAHGGELAFVPTQTGARFDLTLPRVARAQQQTSQQTSQDASTRVA